MTHSFSVPNVPPHTLKILAKCLGGFALLWAVSGCAESSKPNTPVEVETTDSWRLNGQAMVAVADARAAAAAEKVLLEGGHAVDAAIAAHAVLGLVEPQSSGIGGGLFMVVYERESGETHVIDGRETAPAAITPDLFLDDEGKVLGFVPAWQSGRSIGVPGAIAAYEMAHKEYGQAEWAHLFAPAIALASDGFKVSPRLNKSLDNDRLRSAIQLDDTPETANYFYPGGSPLPVGFVRQNPEYANTLRLVAAEGASAFYKGAIAEEIVKAVSIEPLPGQLTLEDLEAYRPVKRDAICGPFKSYKICSAPGPSSGAMAQITFASLYERLLKADETTQDLDEKHLRAFVLAQQLTYADRDHYIADGDFVDIPMDDLLNPTYLDHRANTVHAPGERPQAGDPGDVLRGEPLIDMWGRDTTKPGSGTTHLSIVDFSGNAVAMTATVEAPFGSSRWAAGFLLNNELTDFARQPRVNGKLVANAPAAGKRPRSSMSPTIIFDAENDLYMVAGSPGGNSIIGYVAKVLAAVVEQGKTAQQAINLPNIIARGETVTVEIDDPDRVGPGMSQLLTDMGFSVREREGENSGLHVIVAGETAYDGGADPRREGVALLLQQAGPLPQPEKE